MYCVVLMRIISVKNNMKCFGLHNDAFTCVKINLYSD